jgi:hypothetical protein
MDIAISSIGLATAQSGTAAISNRSTPWPPEKWPWTHNEWATSSLCRPARGAGSRLNGIERWRALVQLALKDCFGDSLPAPNTPIFVASCNGSANEFDQESWSKAFDSAALLEGTSWAGQHVPVFSSSCNSGLQALYAAKQILLANQADEVVIIAADILSRSNQENFEVLRVLTDSPFPWQQTSTGFILGEAAVMLKLVRANDDEANARITGPVLGNELTRNDGLFRVLQQLSAATPQLLLGQGTGSFANDESELSAFQKFFAADVPLATPLMHFGHTLGASGLLSIALAALSQRIPGAEALSALMMPAPFASDGRPLYSPNNVRNNGKSTGVLVSCRALNGSCAAAIVDSAQRHYREQKLQPEKQWQQPTPSGPLMDRTLRQLAIEALLHRPLEPPDVLVVQLDEPLAPPLEARFGSRLLPSAVLELTPGFVSQLIARIWGHAGPTLCMVGASKAQGQGWNLTTAFKDLGLVIAQIHLRGTGDEREIAWNN